MSENKLGIAIIGLAGRFPNAADLDAFWELLKNGREAVVTFSDEELLAAGVDSALLQHPDYVKAGTVVPDVEYFDASFFEMSARDAQITDPQQRLFMECVWQALEQAGYPPATTEARIALYAGVADNTYQAHYLEPNMAELLPAVGWYRLFTISGKDFIATRTAFKLNLTGPALTVQTACSTSLVAVHVACQSLLNFECDMALAGGVSIILPQQRGYLYQEGMIMSPDGHCRAFDAQAQGTIGSGGVGVVMLKRLDEALADGDTIHAVILGSAINNDGADKIGYTAPSVRGQTDVILEAQAAADVHPDEISYIEAHGTATPLGDPIEIQALTQAFRANTQRTGYCAISSVKSNIGHADTAAGVAGLIKTVLALKHRQLPPSLHYQEPNPQIDFANSPFFVNNRLREWEVPDGERRCAGVSSFGIGGTNAHVIVAEAPPIEANQANQASDFSRPMQLLTLSAKTQSALESTTRHLADWLQQHPQLPLADVAYTLNRARQPFSHRRMLLCSDLADAQSQLAQPEHLETHQATEKAREVVFLFPGQGTQYPNMTRGLYETEPAFEAALDECARLLTPHLGQELRRLLYGQDGHDKQHESKLEQTAFTQPVLFAVEYALAKLWMAWGIEPKAMLGHSLGEYVAATLSGVFSLEHALRLVTVRGKLIQSLPSGAMLAVPLSEQAIQPWLSANLSLAVINGSERCVLSGTSEAVAVLQQKLQAQGIECRKLHTSHAFHSHLMEPILAPFAEQMRQVRLHPPTIPYLSNLTGTWISPEQATNPDYWVRHLRETVRFADNLQALSQEEGNLLLEVGPGQTLTALAQQPIRPWHLSLPKDGTLRAPQAVPELVEGQGKHSHQSIVLYSLPRQRETENNAETKQILSTLGRLWANGVAVDWDGFYAEEKRHRLPLPTYPFERQKYWIDAQTPLAQRHAQVEPLLPQQPTAQQMTSTYRSPERSPEPVVLRQAQEPGSKRPLSTLEQEIATIWYQSLGIADIKPDTDFFAVGGDSLLATQLVASLRRRFSINLDTHSLLQAPTVAQLARLITAQIASPEEPPHLPDLVVPIQTGNPARKPLILMHPAGGRVYFYRELARHLDPQLPIYGIRAHGVEGEAEPLTSITEMAALYTEVLQELQPNGPYYLGGASFGGTLAFAMAQQLIAQGETVAFLTLFDTPNMPPGLDERTNIDILLYLLGENAGVDIEALRALDEAEQLDLFVQYSQETPQELQTMLTLTRINVRAMRAYTPPVYPGKLHFFQARTRDEFNPQIPAHGWIELAEQGIEIYTIPGNHVSMNQEPNVQHLAKNLQKCLNQSLVPH